MSWDKPGLISREKPIYTTLLLTNILIVTFLAVLATVSTIIAEGTIRGELALNSRTTTWLTTLNLLGINTIVPSASWFADRFGYKTMLVLGIGVLTFASILAACSINFPMIAAARFLEGVGSGFIFPVGLATITQNLSPKKLPFALILYISAAFGAGFAIGLPLAGYLTQFSSWRWIFILIAASALPILISCSLIHVNTEKKIQAKFDLFGALSFAIFVGSLLIALTYGPMPSTAYGWYSPFILSCFGLAFISLCATVYIEMHVKNPTLPLGLFKNPTYALSCLTVFLLGMSVFATAGTMMEYMIEGLHYDRFVSGKIGIAYGIPLAFFSIIANVLIKKIPVPIVSTIGLALLIYSYFLNNTLSQLTGPHQIIPILLLRGIGLGIALGPVTIQALHSVPKELENKAATILTFFRQVGGTYGGTFISMIVIKRQIFHAALFSEQTNPSLPGVQTTFQKLEGHYHSTFFDKYANSGMLAKARIAENIVNQAFIQAINDAMLIFGYVTIAATLMLVFLNIRNWKKLHRVHYNASHDLDKSD